VTISYLDTSAATELVLDAPQSEALTAEMAGQDDRRLVSSWLLHTEMHCAAGRHPEDVDLEAVGTALDSVSLIDLTRGDLLAAGTHATLGPNDAIHLAVGASWHEHAFGPWIRSHPCEGGTVGRPSRTSRIRPQRSWSSRVRDARFSEIAVALGVPDETLAWDSCSRIGALAKHHRFQER
jgi:hypothetical protein